MITRPEKLFLFLLFFFLPSQLSFHFWPAWSFVSGLRVDYLSPAVYFTDLLILGLLLLWSLRAFSFRPQFKFSLPVLIILMYLVLNIFLALSPWLAFISWLRLFGYFLLVVYLLRRRSLLYSLLSLSLSLSLLWTSLLAWLQLFFQHSLGGIWYWLGERTFSVASPLVAKISLGNLGLFLRPYATFPHPNALAGFLLLGFFLLLIFKSRSSAFSSVIRLAIGVSFLTVFITFSRTAIFLLLFLSLFLYFRRRKFLLLPAAAVFLLLLSRFGNPNSLTERFLLLQKSLFLIFRFPLLGVGLNNFIPVPYHFPAAFSYLAFQPVHNIFLLLAAELGLPALVFILICICIYFRKLLSAQQPYLLVSALAVIVTGLIDHYWLTSPQNLLLLSVFLALVGLESYHVGNSAHPL